MRKFSSKNYTSCQHPVLILGLAVNGLGVLRSLAGLTGIHVADTDLNGCYARTRYGQKHLVSTLDTTPVGGLSLVDEIERICHAIGAKPLLIPTQEKSVIAILANYERISRFCEPCFGPPDITAALLDKSQFHALASTRGFPTPETRIVFCEKDLDGMPIPCVLKPTTRQARYEASHNKAYRLDSTEELVQTYRRVSADADIFVAQQWIEGGDDSLYFCLQYRNSHGNCNQSFVGRKLVQWPPLVGGTARCTSAPEHHETLTTITSNFFDEVGYTGLGGIEFKRDAIDGSFYMIEPTVGRTDYQHEVSALNEVEVLMAMVKDFRGEHSPVTVYRNPPAVWNDSLAVANAEKFGAISPSCAGKQVDAVQRFADPVPWLCTVAQRVKRKFS